MSAPCNLKGHALHEALRAAVCQPTRMYLWTPADAVDFTPALSDEVWGDGRALLALTTINSRPRYYVIRIDSKWRVGHDIDAPNDAEELVDFIDDIEMSLEEEFGDGRPSCEQHSERSEAEYEMTDEEWEYGNPWPAFDGRDGCSWWRIDWPESVVSTELHPFTSRAKILAVQNDFKEPDNAS